MFQTLRKYFWKAFRRRFQPLQNISKAPPRNVLEVDYCENLIFKDILHGIKAFGNAIPEALKNARKALSGELWRRTKAGFEIEPRSKIVFCGGHPAGEGAGQASLCWDHKTLQAIERNALGSRALKHTHTHTLTHIQRKRNIHNCSLQEH